MKVIGLFAGVGGFEKGFELAGHEITGLCELDADATVVLKRGFPAATLHSDINEFKELPPATEVVLAGFPCQDLSQAGKMAGIEGSRSGLVNRVFDLVEHRKVDWIVFENVQNLIRLHGGAGISHVVRSLERLGYSWAYRVVDTRAFGLPQRRLRVFVVASRVEDPCTVLFADNAAPAWVADDLFDPDTTAYGFYWTEGNRGVGWARDSIPTLKGGSAFGIPSPPAVWRPDHDDVEAFVTPGIDDAEALQGFDRGWSSLDASDAARERRRWRMVGNAVSVPVAQWIGERMAAPGSVELPLGVPVNGKWPLAARGGPNERAMSVTVSTWPKNVPSLGLSSMLTHPASLSGRAAVGFYDRLIRSTLRGGPDQFRRALAAYCTAKGFERNFTRAEPSA